MNINYFNSRELHNRIKALRIEHGYTQKYVADYIDVDVTTYAHYERHHRTPSTKVLQKLAELYNILDPMLNAKYPLITVEQYPKELLDNLEDVLSSCAINENTTHNDIILMLDSVRKAFDPIMLIWKENISVPETIGLPEPETTILRAYLDPRAQSLIEKCMNKQSELYDALQGTSG